MFHIATTLSKKIKSQLSKNQTVSINISSSENTSLIPFSILGVIACLRDKPHQTTPVLEHWFPWMDVGENAGRGRRKKKKETKGEMLESEVNANDSRYLNDGIYTGRLHGDDLQPNRPICLGYSIYAFLWTKPRMVQRDTFLFVLFASKAFRNDPGGKNYSAIFVMCTRC